MANLAESCGDFSAGCRGDSEYCKDLEDCPVSFFLCGLILQKHMIQRHIVQINAEGFENVCEELQGMRGRFGGNRGIWKDL